MHEDDGNELVGLSERPIKDAEKLRRRIFKLFDREELKNPWLVYSLNNVHQRINFEVQCEEYKSLGLTKSQKIAARRLASALRRVEIALTSVEVPGFYFRGFPRAEIRKWRTLFEAVSSRKSEKFTRLNAMKKRLAIAEAYKLLKSFDPRHRITAAKGGKFCELAALLYGDPDIDLRNQCKSYLITSKKSVSK